MSEAVDKVRDLLEKRLREIQIERRQVVAALAGLGESGGGVDLGARAPGSARICPSAEASRKVAARGLASSAGRMGPLNA